jgi:hypothetical protein
LLDSAGFSQIVPALSGALPAISPFPNTATSIAAMPIELPMSAEFQPSTSQLGMGLPIALSAPTASSLSLPALIMPPDGNILPLTPAASRPLTPAASSLVALAQPGAPAMALDTDTQRPAVTPVGIAKKHSVYLTTRVALPIGNGGKTNFTSPPALEPDQDNEAMVVATPQTAPVNAENSAAIALVVTDMAIAPAPSAPSRPTPTAHHQDNSKLSGATRVAAMLVNPSAPPITAPIINLDIIAQTPAAPKSQPQIALNVTLSDPVMVKKPATPAQQTHADRIPSGPIISTEATPVLPQALAAVQTRPAGQIANLAQNQPQQDPYSKSSPAPADAQPAHSETNPAAQLADTGSIIAPIAAPAHAVYPATSIAPQTSTNPAPALSNALPDMTALVDRLVEARAAFRSNAAPQLVQTSIQHADFGRVSLSFNQDDLGIKVNLTSNDPGFASAAQAALTTPAIIAPQQTDMGQRAGDNSANSSARQQPETRQDFDSGTTLTAQNQAQTQSQSQPQNQRNDLHQTRLPKLQAKHESNPNPPSRRESNNGIFA